ncbi:MAG: sugar kinase [Armatimonadota bacterium]|nr:sugar kinase [Armatimonadota bacterium]
MPDIVAVGEPMAEFAATERGRLSTVTGFRRGWGGDTSNFVVAAARLGASSGYITRLGGDEFGRSFLDLWQREGVDASQVIVEPEGFTAVYFIALDEQGRHSFTYYRAHSAASRLGPSDLDRDYLASACIVHTSGITQAISASACEAALVALRLAREGRITTSYDANVRPRLMAPDALRRTVLDTFTLADVVFLSTEDAGHLFGETAGEEVVSRILRLGPRIVVLRQGPLGCLVGTADGLRVTVPGWRVAAVDATGAGDAFNAAFLIRWLEGAPLEQAARFANAVGALVTTGLGAVAPIPRRPEVEAFMAREASGDEAAYTSVQDGSGSETRREGAT